MLDADRMRTVPTETPAIIQARFCKPYGLSSRYKNKAVVNARTQRYEAAAIEYAANQMWPDDGMNGSDGSRLPRQCQATVFLRRSSALARKLGISSQSASM